MTSVGVFRRGGVLALLTLLALGLVGSLGGCNLNDEGLQDPVANSYADKDGIGTSHVVAPYTQAELLYFWEGSDHGDWDVITGQIDPAVGGRVSGVPASWPTDKDYTFSVSFPPGALPGTDPVTVSIKVPRNNRTTMYAPVFELEPDGIVFNEPVTVQFNNPPWRPAAARYAKFCLKRDLVNGEPRLEATDYAKVVPSGEDPALGLIFRTTHFSRWGMDNGQGGDAGQTYTGPYRRGVTN